MSGEDPGKSATRDDMKYMEDRCPVTELEAWDRARHESTVASWAFGLGGASLAAGVVVYLLAPSSERASTALRLSPLLGTKSAGLAATGRF